MLTKASRFLLSSGAIVVSALVCGVLTSEQAILVAVAPATAQTGAGTVQGRVQTTSGEPIPNAQVMIANIASFPSELAEFMQTIPRKLQVTPTLIQEAGRVEMAARAAAVPSSGASGPGSGFSATTDAMGRFTFSNVPAGKYSLQARTPGYFSPSTPGMPGRSGAMISWFEVRGGDVADLLLRVVKGGTVSGRLTNADGRPAPAVAIAAFKKEYALDGRVLFTASISRTTDDRGEFRMFDLAPGEYRIAPTDPGFPRPRMIQDPDTAYSVVVTDGTERSGATITRPAPPTSRVSGRVIFSAGDDPAPADRRVRSFYLVPLDARAFTDSDAPTFTNTSSDPTTFEISGVPPGPYELMSVPTNSFRYLGRTFIDVPMGNLENVSLTIRPNVEVKARLVYAGGVAPPGAGTPTLQLKPKERYAVALEAIRWMEDAKADVSGFIVFSRVPQGRYTFEVSGLAANAYVADIRESGRSVFDEGLVIASAPASVEVVVDLSGETVEGILQDAEQKPVALERVVLVPDQPRRQNHALFKTALTDASGRFVFRGVAPGNYKIFGWTSSQPPNAHLNAEFIANYEAFGQPVQVTKAFRGQVSLTATPAK
jgi:hypothetical protein